MSDIKQPMDRQRAEAKARVMPADAPDSFSTATLDGRNGIAELTVLPFFDWADDWRQCVDGLDFRGWAQAVLDADNFTEWVRIAPSVRQAREFINSLEAQTGEDLGESQAS